MNLLLVSHFFLNLATVYSLGYHTLISVSPPIRVDHGRPTAATFDADYHLKICGLLVAFVVLLCILVRLIRHGCRLCWACHRRRDVERGRRQRRAPPLPYRPPTLGRPMVC